MKTTPRQALTDAAEHLRAELGDTPANALLGYRDQHHPLASGPAKHSWGLVPFGEQRRVPNRTVERVCRRCGLSDEYRPLTEGGRWVGVWHHADGRVEQRSKTKTPPCLPLSDTTTTERN